MRGGRRIREGKREKGMRGEGKEEPGEGGRKKRRRKAIEKRETI